MKKTYIIPELMVQYIAPETLIAESLPKGDDTITDPDDILVKENRQNYDVWDDDWQKQ